MQRIAAGGTNALDLLAVDGLDRFGEQLAERAEIRHRNLAKAWNLISAAPARAAGLSDRGVLAEGYRADIVLVDADEPMRPRIVAVIAAGRLVYLTDASRLIRPSHARREAVATA